MRPTFGRIPEPALWVFDTIGLAVFIGCVGISAGPSFDSGLKLTGPRLRAARAQGILDYGRLGQRYATDFHDKWSRGGRQPEEPLLGSPDIQSLADLRNALIVIENMRRAPFGMRSLTTVAMHVVLPIAPLLLTTFSLEQLLDRMLKTLL